MGPLDIEQCLQSMSILIDTREQPSERAMRRYSDFPCPCRRQTLDYGDYTYNFVFPDGTELFKPTDRAAGVAIVERKMDLNELSNCLTHDRKRFVAEFDRAREHSAKIYLLVEDASWENLINGRYKTKFNPKSYFASVTAFMARYDISPIFCKQETSGKMIHQILYRELKERLERGEYG